MKFKLLGSALCYSALMAFSGQAGAAFSVNGPQLLDGNGNPFVMRGVNYPHAWFDHETESALPAIADTGANTVRVVLSNGTHATGWTKNTAEDVADIIALGKENNLILMLEVHDVTGSGDNDEAGEFDAAVDYWIEIQDVLEGQEDYVLINIANEPFGNSVPEETWVNKHIEAIETLREAGLTHTLVVDAPAWGQDADQVMLEEASTVFEADALANTIFSVHMYEVYQTPETVTDYIDTFIAEHNLPLIVGEFGPEHNGHEVAVDAILAHAEEMDVGYLAWSWSGNSESTSQLDLVEGFDAEALTAWGERVVNGENGIAATGEPATVFSDAETPDEPEPEPAPEPQPLPEPTEVSAPGSNGGGGSISFYLLGLMALVSAAYRVTRRQ